MMSSIIPQLIVNSIIAGSIYSLVALGFNLIFGTTRFFNLAHGVVSTVGGYGVFTMLKIFDQNIFISIIFGIISAAFIGWLSEKIIYRPMRKSKASSTVMLVASLGLFTMLQAIIAIIFSSQFKTLSTNVGSTKVYEIFGGIITQTQVIILFTAILIMIGLGLMMKFTKLGKAVRAISDDEEVAKIVGIDTNKIISKVFIIGSAIAGVAGIAIGFDTGIDPTMGMGLLFKGVIAVIIGGVGNVYGGVAGAFFLGFVENFGIWKISGEWKDTISFIVLLLFLIFRPGGIFSKKK
jgi:branched-subunit amino acid ABC-type transport system permease component